MKKKELFKIIQYNSFLEKLNEELEKLLKKDTINSSLPSIIKIQKLLHIEINQFYKQFINNVQFTDFINTLIKNIPEEEIEIIIERCREHQKKLLKNIELHQKALQHYGWIKALLVLPIRLILEMQHFSIARLWLDALQDIPVGQLDENYLKGSKQIGGIIYLIADSYFSYLMASPSKSILNIVPNFVLQNTQHTIIKKCVDHNLCAPKTTLNRVLPISSWILNFLALQLIFNRSKNPALWMLGLWSYFFGTVVNSLLLKSSIYVVKTGYRHLDHQLEQKNPTAQAILNKLVNMLTQFPNINIFALTLIQYFSYFLCSKAGMKIGINTLSLFEHKQPSINPEEIKKQELEKELMRSLHLDKLTDCREVNNRTRTLIQNCHPDSKRGNTSNEISCPDPINLLGIFVELAKTICPKK